ncbi:hypothetical protein ABG768_003221 [Culter alburnus]|uniref:Uncharacterized protein n=1 Tax=Culter alburnus TaxID=194366 RepID=A0AAW1ZXM6_CULAL
MDGQHCPEALNTASVMQYTTIRTKPSSPQEQLQYREFSEITYPDISRTKQTKLPRRKGGETVFCLVSRRGEVSGLSSSPEEPLKCHVLPLLTDSKPNDVTITPEQTDSPQCIDDSRQNQDEAVRQLHGSFMLGEYGNTPLEHTGGDQRSSSIQDFGNEIKPNQCYVQKNDSQSSCLTMQTNGNVKPCKEIIEKFPLWKEPKYQHQLTGPRNEQSQEVNDESKLTNTEDINKSTEDQQKSLVVIDATCVVVKVELVLLPEKEHVQYVCLTEESPLSSTREGIEQHSSIISSQETPENNTLDKGEERILEIPHEYPRTGLQTYESISQELVSSCGSNMVDPMKEFEESPSAVEAVEVLENELMVGQPWSGTTLENNEGLEETLNIIRVGNQSTAKEPEAMLEDFVALTNAHSTSEVIVDPIKEFEESPSAVEAVEVLENELMVGQPWNGTTLENEGLEETLNIIRVGNQSTAKEPEAMLEDFVALTNAHSTSEVIVDPIKEFEESPSAVEAVEVLENELMVGQPWSGTTLENNEGLEETLNIIRVGNQTTAKEPEAMLVDFVALTNAHSTSEVSEDQTEKTPVEINQNTNQENGPTLDDSAVEHKTQKDNENYQKDTLPKDSSIEEHLSDEIDDRQELVLDCSKPLLKQSAIKEIQHGVHKFVLPSIVGFSTLRRSSSLPNLSFTSSSNSLDGSNTENEPLLLPLSTNTKGTKYSSLTSLFSTPVPVTFENSSLSKTADVLLCTSSAPEHKQKIQHAKSLWDAVSRIRKHTAPDSETEEEEVVEYGEQTEGVDTEFLYQRLNTEQEQELEDDTSEKSTKTK